MKRPLTISWDALGKEIRAAGRKYLQCKASRGHGSGFVWCQRPRGHDGDHGGFRAQWPQGAAK